MDHDEKLELAAAELAAALEQIKDRGTCPVCLAALLMMVAEGMRQDWPEQPEKDDLVSGYFTNSIFGCAASRRN